MVLLKRRLETGENLGDTDSPKTCHEAEDSYCCTLILITVWNIHQGTRDLQSSLLLTTTFSPSNCSNAVSTYLERNRTWFWTSPSVFISRMRMLAFSSHSPEYRKMGKRYMINHIAHLQSLVPGIQPNERLGVDESILYALSSARIRGCRVMKEKLLGNVKLWKLISDTFIAPGNTSIDIRLLDTTFHQVEGNCNCVNLNRDFLSEFEMGAFRTGSSDAKIVLYLTMKCNFLFVNVSLILPLHECKTARLLRIHHLKYYHWIIKQLVLSLRLHKCEGPKKI